MSDDDKTRRLDDEYFKKIAERAKGVPVGSDQDKTQIVGQKPERETYQSDSDKTQIYRSANVSDVPELDLMGDPPTGWLVAISGPGKGSVLTIGIGNNGVGRGSEARINIPFDDNQISRGQSFSVVYDPKNRRYYLLPGTGKTLLYYCEEPVLERLDLKTGMCFQVGGTSFRFIALCDETFDWQ